MVSLLLLLLTLLTMEVHGQSKTPSVSIDFSIDKECVDVGDSVCIKVELKNNTDAVVHYYNLQAVISFSVIEEDSIGVLGIHYPFFYLFANSRPKKKDAPLRLERGGSHFYEFKMQVTEAWFFGQKEWKADLRWFILKGKKDKKKRLKNAENMVSPFILIRDCVEGRSRGD